MNIYKKRLALSIAGAIFVFATSIAGAFAVEALSHINPLWTFIPGLGVIFVLLVVFIHLTLEYLTGKG